MKIQDVVLDGFKNLSNVKIHFDTITALVALNNFGKSNVLSGIDFGIAFMKASIDEKQNMMGNTNLIPLHQKMIGRNFRFEMELSMIVNHQKYLCQYGFEFSWKTREDKEPEIIYEFLKLKLDAKGKKYVQLINRTKSEAYYRSSEGGRCSSKIKVDSAELVINKLRAYDDLYYANMIAQLNSIKIYMENNLDVKNFYQPDPIIRRGLDIELINANNLPRVIYQLKEKNPDKLELLKDVYFQLFPNIEDIIVKEFNINSDDNVQLPDELPFIVTNSFYALYVKDKNLSTPVNFAMMSDGAKRVFMILVKIILSSMSGISLIAIEEPENSVHPGLFQAYLQIMSQLLEDCKVIITSHSPYIISYLNPSWIYVGINREDGIAEFFSLKKTGNKQLVKDASKFDMSMGDYLFSMLADSDNNISDYLEFDANE